ncbi:MAG: hypothetical protein BGO86_14495 [Chryseobacterium sp. 36-9]|uniref:DUF2723 domain-containing protein n=1 Tax=Epilithonimonas pallida TaxID=373671 RepID=A0ABY1R1I5_9FLAO|nr:DUF2723 domain-containing protein [Epilithonimonas pallida]OJX29568.1 MAG: hypothetical protein BGO86_14495 [Chryseobacterium sp. 36-9]SMP91322.1 Protein of unknown function [Epilithonimonas pallida]
MNKKTITFLIFLVFLVIYYAGSFSKISFGDCIGFVLDVEKREFLLDFMPLTHFLYMNTAIFFSKYLAMDSVLVMRLMSVVPAAITVSLVFVLIKEFVEENWIALMSTSVFGFCFTFWRSAETIEVYTFNAFWIILFLIYSVKSLKNRSKNYLIIAGFVLGLSLWVHIQNIMLIPAYMVLLYLLKSDRKKVIISFIVFLVPLFFMFWVNYLQGIDIKYAFFSKKGPWVEDTFNQGIKDLLKDIAKASAFLIYNFNVFILFSFAGIIYLYKNFKTESFFLFTACLFTLGFATFYAVSDNYVFFIPFYIIFTAFIALGIKKLSSKYALKRLMLTPLLIPLFYIFSLYIVSLTPQGKKFHQEKLYKDGLCYYMLPWLNNNIGCIEFTLNNGQTRDNVIALKLASKEFIELRKKYQTIEEIRDL